MDWPLNHRDQDLNDGNHKKHKRGWVSKANNPWSDIFDYEYTIPAHLNFVSFRVTPHHGKQTDIAMSFFFFTLYLSLYFLGIPWVTKGREYGFAFTDYWDIEFRYKYDSGFSNGGDVKGKRWSFNILDLLFGKVISFSKEVLKTYTPETFVLNTKTYTAEKVVIERHTRFRSRIPYCLYKKEHIRFDIEVSDPPKHAGKGENSWDQCDDGTYAMSALVEKEFINEVGRPTFKNRKAYIDYAIKRYVDSYKRSVEKYGEAQGR